MEKLTVYYDGACPLCAREVAAYRRLPGAQGLEFIDASSCPAEALGPDLSRPIALSAMHVRRPDGTLVSGARAFAEIWQRLPGLRWLALLWHAPGLPWLAELAYRAFLRLRRAWRRPG
ncbi:MAG: DUF393 domain-containing protein [Rhodovarius sp.]|nr:DUF393 domain-containing protein [Rhodovarius sp.]MDW8313846.1 DUF393 domain-containing protein [Rhodovarius sp.]